MLNDIVNNGIVSNEKIQKTGFKPLDNTQVKEAFEVKAKATSPEKPDLNSAVSKLNDYVQNIQRTLSFSIEETTGITVVKVLDSETDEVIRQIPVEETIKLALSIEANLSNLLLKEQA